MTAPNPPYGNYELSSVDNEPLPGLPKEMNEGADIGEEAAVQRALLTGARFKATNPTVIRCTLMTYFEARKFVEPIDNDDPDAQIQVRLVEMSGTFQGSRHRRGMQTSTRCFNKAYVILRASDGLRLGYSLTKE
ncbi:hypothetical protein NIES4071_61720 [Calothrix sp. NIES-4071]|nr:hypothetical protein NIES4071_61720 [Calothrix sp. NIES-4071]BAZ60476.1 hypothetical protein NIES4105_61670 [Calothrix sp. NIES-4105]